ncbi:MAG TPA: hypothetical protein VNZ47_13360 [Candidatus Dormibacteraeota bacterium]|jgi:hypothetical protein|nr:hypothetical protein [Candidatus Dormibacteraeota bacterium]
MKSSWIAAALLSVTAWPGSKAFPACSQQSPADGKPVQQAQASSSLAGLEDSVYAVTVKPPVAATTTPNATAETVKPKGSYMLVELSKPLKAKKLKVGDKVKAEVTQDVVSHGKVIIPVETKLVGHVTEVSTKDSGHPESRLGIVFDRILLKHYHDIDFQAVVQAVSQPVIRRSRVDEPSQMLPPSMMGGPSRDTSAIPGSRGSTSTRGNSGGGSSGGAAGVSSATVQAPITVKQSPSTHVNASGALLEVVSNGKPMSVGMPQGVIGLKGLSLSTGPSPSTPGPVIVSNTDNVKLDSGTQILLHVLKVEIPANVKSKPVK